MESYSVLFCFIGIIFFFVKLSHSELMTSATDMDALTVMVVAVMTTIAVGLYRRSQY